MPTAKTIHDFRDGQMRLDYVIKNASVFSIGESFTEILRHGDLDHNDIDILVTESHDQTFLVFYEGMPREGWLPFFLDNSIVLFHEKNAPEIQVMKDLAYLVISDWEIDKKTIRQIREAENRHLES